MSKKIISKMDLKEFRDFGFLQEVNRTFFHPMGMAMSIDIDEDGNHILGDIWDYRDDPIGIEFAEGLIDQEKVERVKNWMDSKSKARIAKFGSIIQTK